MCPLRKKYAIETIKLQCDALRKKGYQVFETITGTQDDAHARVVVIRGLKAWNFNDPDIEVIISQICTLTQTLERNAERLRKTIEILSGGKLRGKAEI